MNILISGHGKVELNIAVFNPTLREKMKIFFSKNNFSHVSKLVLIYGYFMLITYVLQTQASQGH